ncbi:hypothetical protein NM208_g16664 [Fusarium decemcellulare]|uniref:Uncharacterized protein n=1 Tax=Fusarium decemcellulare TaxID=57161 RepID=A0ACC1RCY6_9HYPO|nr:hypothetical protein NM208_g16664 [Fusarium decemcellulare]
MLAAHLCRRCTEDPMPADQREAGELETGFAVLAPILGINLQPLDHNETPATSPSNAPLLRPNSIANRSQSKWPSDPSPVYVFPDSMAQFRALRLPGPEELLPAVRAFRGLTLWQMLRRNLVLDLSIALGNLDDADNSRDVVGGSNGLTSIVTGTGFVMANFFWYGFHMPRTNARDNYYIKLEEERAANKN